jgi:hypothetical protein
MPMPAPGVGHDRRRAGRIPITLPVRVRGGGDGGNAWEEVTTCVDVGRLGAGVHVSHPVRVGEVLHLSLPLPTRFREYDLTEGSYKVYALIRSIRPSTTGSRVGVVFVGRRPPKGSPVDPAQRDSRPADRPATGPAPRPSFRFQLDADHAAGGVAQEEEAVPDQLEPRSAVVRVCRLRVGRGAVLTVEEVGGDFRSQAEVSGISIEKDGAPRLSLRFLDGPVPDRLLPPSRPA